MGHTTDLKSLGNVHSNFFDRKQINGRLQQRSPDSFVREEGLELDAEFERLQLANAERAHLERISGLLRHPALAQFVADGKITVGLVKPHVNKGKVADESDEDIAQKILREEIKQPLEVLFSLPIWMTPGDIDAFYSDVKPALEKIPDDDGKSTVWARHSRYMASGAVTFVLLYSPEGNAVAEWRRQMGPTRPEQDTTGKSIRARYGFDVRNNIVHGSNADDPADYAKNVQQEIDWMKGKVERLLNPPEIGEDDLLTEERLRACGVLVDGDVFLGVEQFIPTQPVGRESASFAAYIVTFIDEEGKIQRRRFVTKDKPTQQDAESEVGRLRTFQAIIEQHWIIGINHIPRIYHVGTTQSGSGRFVRDYVPDHTATVRRIGLNPEFDIQLRHEIIKSLAEVAALLDSQGIRSKRMCEAFICTGTGFTYIGSSNLDFVETHMAALVETGLADVLAVYGEDEDMSRYIKVVYAAAKERFLRTGQKT